METILIQPETTVANLLSQYPQVIPVFIRHRMSCVGCSMSTFESLKDAAKIYGVPLNDFIQEVSEIIQTKPNPDDSIHLNTKPRVENPMTSTYTFFPQITQTIDTIPHESIVSRTIYRDGGLKTIVFAFAPGQELSEHTASVPAIIHILEGEGELTLGADHYPVKAGAWAQMPAKLPHSIVAQTPMKMLLIMLQNT